MRRIHVRTLSPVIALLLSVTVLACGDGGGGGGSTEPVVPASITVTPETVTFSSLGETHQLSWSVLDAAEAMFAVTEMFRIGRLERLAYDLSTDDYFDGLAQNRALDNIYAARIAITNAALAAAGPKKSARAAAAEWHDANELRIGRVQDRIGDMTTSGGLTVSRLTVAAGLLADLVS